MSSIYNSPFEMELRALLVLGSASTKYMSVDRIVFYDFITTQGMEFSVSTKNLHGINQFGFSELTSRRALFVEGIKGAMMNGLITINRTGQGYLYALTENGAGLIDFIDVDYKREYVDIMQIVDREYSDMTDVELMRVIIEKAKHALRR